MSEVNNHHLLNLQQVSVESHTAAAQLSDLSSFISHELRTPLTSIQGALRLLHMGHLGSLTEEGQRLLNIAIHNTHRLTRLAEAIEHEPAISMSIISELEIEQLQLENDFYSAFECQELQLFYQPIIAIQTNRITGFEALARWHHPSKGWISPATFIPLAEKIGLIHQLGLWSLEQACRQLAEWQQQFPTQPPLTMNVNLSTLQLLQPDLAPQILHIIQSTHIAPSSLKLEITESALIENYEAAIAILSNLRAIGVQFYVDDFGTGYSSLGRLKELPIDALKIDRSFISGRKWDISETILLLANKLGLDVVAEGVETSEEVDSLKTLGCHHMQGYFFSRPIDSQMASDLLASYAIMN
ncbi:EAL domain-containing protein [Leptolyngbyaceae cyanobacterium JSC-12]|nr:EAL domain-containing protein [Leptolyngbyaceae cyanobacterium JSC-12]